MRIGQSAHEPSPCVRVSICPEYHVSYALMAVRDIVLSKPPARLLARSRRRSYISTNMATSCSRFTAPVLSGSSTTTHGHLHLHSSTLQLNVSTFCGLHASTCRLDVSTFSGLCWEIS